ncbi:hypothetical protein EB796_021898 [Bugula neritina]|uniref:Uncharacterized protein n=1 Tax=Bugula neritina TaxID=10212 RepID=A0A7J7J2Y8_BUGNE|nr:hypothetical protein EB796_021898 [Bugula neritina]
MGNSSSHSFSKSRSTSLTDLPYKIGNTSYTGSSKHGLRASAVISSTSQLPHRPTSYKDDSLAPKRALSFASPDRTATLPGTKREPAGRQGLTRISSEVQTTQRQSSLIQPGPKQYNDAYLQSDVKRLFKAHDKSGSKASTVEEDDTSTEALDKKLATLKKQRGKGELTETLSTNIPPPKKSRKTRKAPGMPPSERNDDKNLISTSAGNKQLTKNTKISNRKSTPAPLPPSKVDTPPASKKEQTSDEPIQLPVAAPTLSVQQANSAELLKNVDKDDTDAEKSTVNALPEMSILQEPKVVVCSTPQSKGNQADLVEKAAEDSNETKASATLIEREVTPFKERVPLKIAQRINKLVKVNLPLKKM